MTMQKRTNERTTYIPQFGLFYEGVRKRGIDCLQGAGGFHKIERWLNQMVSHVPGLAKVKSIGAWHRHTYIRLSELGDPDGRFARHSAREIDDEVFATVGEDEYLRGLEELLQEASKQPIPPDVSTRLLAWHLAHKHYLMMVLCYFRGTVMAIRWIGECAGKEAMEIRDDPLPGGAHSTLWYLSRMRMEVIEGYGSESIEEKNILQYMFIGGYAVAHKQRAHLVAVRFLYSAVRAYEWGSATTRFHAGWMLLDARFQSEFTEGLAKVFGPDAAFLETAKPTREVGIECVPAERPKGVQYPFSFYLADKRSWMSGMDTIVASEYSEFPYLSGQRWAAATMVLGPPGSGKTTILFSIAAKAVHEGALVTIFKGDSTNQGCYLCLPSSDRKVQMELGKMGVVPHPLPIMILNVITRNQRDLLREYPFTKFDRVIFVDSTRSFDFDFSIIVKKLDEMRAEYPAEIEWQGRRYPVDKTRMGAILITKYLGRETPDGETNEDLQVSWNLNRIFKRWRERVGGKRPVLDLRDELHDMAPRTIEGREAGPDKSSTRGQLNQMLMDARRLNVAITGSTQQPLDLIASPVKQATNVLFKNLAREEADFLLKRATGVLQLPNVVERELALTMNEAKAFGGDENYCWFWSNDDLRELHVVSSCPPPTYLQETGKDRWEPYRRYEKLTGEKILLNWKEIDWEKVTITEAGASMEAYIEEAEAEAGFRGF